MKTKHYKILSILAMCSMHIALHAQTITLDFENDSVTGGDLNITTSGSDPVDSFKGDRFDEQTSSTFDIQNISGFGTLNVTATPLLDDLNVTGSGLQDGSSGFDTASEGTSFVFDENVIITALDWGVFTSAGSDSVTLSSGGTPLGTFADGETGPSSIDFTNTNPSTMSIDVASGDAFEIAYDGGDFFLENMSFDINPVPEPSTYAAILGLISLGFVAYRKRRQ